MHSIATVNNTDYTNEIRSHSDEDRFIEQVGWRLEEVHEKGLLEVEN